MTFCGPTGYGLAPGTSAPGSVGHGFWREDHISSFSFTSDFTRCVVALYFSGALLGVNTETFEVFHKAETATAVRDVLLLDDGRSVAQPSRSGEVVVRPLNQEPFAFPRT
jgi:hypothetical protein